MNERHARQSKSHVSEQEIRLINYEDACSRNRVLDLCKLIETGRKRDGLDLPLEVEIDDELRDLLSSDQDCTDLLDFKLVQQTNSCQETSVSLSVNEFNDLIEMINQHNPNGKTNESLKHLDQYVQKRTSKVNERNSAGDEKRSLKSKLNVLPKQQETKARSPFVAGDNKSSKCPYSQFFEEKLESDGYQSSGIPNETTVYTTTPRTFENVQKKLHCLDNHNSGEKPGTPCLCQHCGMVGVLVESQKRPAIPHTPNPKFNPPAPKASHKRRIIDLRSKSKSETNLILLRELATKITSLEDRIHQHEEKTVRKDYFKFIIHKLLSQYSSKLNEIKTKTVKTTVNTATQYSRTNNAANRYHSLDRYQQFGTAKENYKSYYAQEVETEMESERSYEEERDFRRSRYRDDLPEIRERSELRKKITNIIEDKLKSTSRKPRKTDPKTEKHNEILRLPPNINDVKLNKKSIYVTTDTDSSPFQAKRVRNNFEDNLVETIEREVDENMSAHTIKQLCDLVYSKYFERTKHQKSLDDKLFRRNINNQKKSIIASLFDECDFGLSTSNKRNFCHGDIPDKLLRPKRKDSIKEKAKSKDGVKMANARKVDKHDFNVKYVNPSIRKWEDDQSTDHEIKVQASSKKPNKHTIEEKVQYLRSLAKKKNVDEAELWTNILNQARKHIKSNEDTVSIQLPGTHKNREMSELELTLSTLKEIVKQSRQTRRNSSLSIELNYKTSSDNFIKKRGNYKKK